MGNTIDIRFFFEREALSFLFCLCSFVLKVMSIFTRYLCKSAVVGQPALRTSIRDNDNIAVKNTLDNVRRQYVRYGHDLMTATIICRRLASMCARPNAEARIAKYYTRNYKFIVYQDMTLLFILQNKALRVRTVNNFQPVLVNKMIMIVAY